MRVPRGVLAITALIACGCEGTSTRVAVGAPAPPFHAATLTGDTVSLDQWRGSAILLNVWATWCEPCRREMPGLEALHREFEPLGLRVIGVSVDDRSATPEVGRFVQEMSVSFTIALDPADRVSRSFRLIGVPNTVLIDRTGVIAHRWIGEFDPTGSDARAKIRAVLNRTT